MLVNVRKFQQCFDSAQNWPVGDDERRMLEKTVDISVEELGVRTHFEQVEQQIMTSLSESVEPAQVTKQRRSVIKSMPSQLDNTELPSSSLQSLSAAYLRERVHRVRSNENYICKEGKKLATPETDSPTAESPSNSAPYTLAPPDVIISVSFHTIDKPTKVQEYLVHGQQFLTALRDRFYCLEDHILLGPSTPSSYFLIEGTFYCDTRNPRAIDYSKEIREHFKLVPFTSKPMEETQFVDLQVVLGKRYVFCHQGNHEHAIVFNQLRFVHDGDELNPNVYPILIFQSKLKIRKCSVCDIHAAKFVCYDDKQTPESPYLFCEVCYHSLHYNDQDIILYSDYKVFPYYHE
eukprot:c4272_g1_i1.p1 GENE.c4272_g1_i1~~c4272_g1_i1.p1  ORF type:complete len:348 (-),score=80.12 c4272_g1_i1:15-1058(-)